MRLGIKVRQADIVDPRAKLPLTQIVKNNLAAECFNEAGLKLDEFLNPHKNIKLIECSFIEKIDLMISRAQMYLWTAHNMSYIYNKACNSIQSCFDNLKVHSLKYDYYEFVDKFVTNTKPVIMIYQAINTMNDDDAKTLKNYFDKMTELQNRVQEKLK